MNKVGHIQGSQSQRNLLLEPLKGAIVGPVLKKKDDMLLLQHKVGGGSEAQKVAEHQRCGWADAGAE